MHQTDEFQIGFGHMARTVAYEDAQGTLCFPFGINSWEERAMGRWDLYLGRQPLTSEGDKLDGMTPDNHERIATALERAKEYAASCGYSVKLD